MVMSAGRQSIALLVPAFNAAAYLPRLLRSAHAQTEPFDHIWVYDDCSTDNTAEVALAHGAQVLRGTVNKGCSAGKQALAEAVQADWLHFHDADDELLPNFVELARAWIDRGAPDVVLFDYEYRDNDTDELLLRRHFDDAQLKADPRRYSIREQINAICGLYRRQPFLSAGGYRDDPAVLYNEDVACHIRLAFAGLTFGAENEVSIVNYRIGGSMSGANQLRCLRSHHAVMQRTLQHPDAGPYRAEIAAKLWAVAGRLAAYDAWADADLAVATASSIAPPTSPAGSAAFRALARIHPHMALRMRERWIRWRRPGQRESPAVATA